MSFLFYIKPSENKGFYSEKDGPMLRFNVGKTTIAFGKVDIEDLLKSFIDKFDTHKEEIQELTEDLKKEVENLKEKLEKDQLNRKEIEAKNEELEKKIKELLEKIEELEYHTADYDDVVNDLDYFRDQAEKLEKDIDSILRYVRLK